MKQNLMQELAQQEIKSLSKDDKSQQGGGKRKAVKGKGNAC